MRVGLCSLFVVALLLGGTALSTHTTGQENALESSSLKLERQAAELAVQNSGNDQDRATALSKLGDIEVELGDLVAARDSYQKSLDIQRNLAAIEPRSGLHIKMVVNLTKAGSIQVKQNDFVGARSSYEEQLAIVRQWVAAEPGSTDWRDLLVTSLHQNGDVQLALGQPVEALASYQESLVVSRGLAAIDPSSSGLQYQVSVSMIKVADAQIANGNPESARSSFQESLDILRRLAAVDPRAVEVHRDIVVNLVRINELTKDPAYSAEAFEIALAMEERGILAPEDTWMLDDLRGRAAQSTPGRQVTESDADICPALKSAMEHGRNKFADISGDKMFEDDETFRKTSLVPEWARDCSVSIYEGSSLSSWACSASYGSGVDLQSGFELIQGKVLACLDPDWTSVRADGSLTPNVVFSNSSLNITVMGYDNYAHIEISTKPDQ